MLTAWLLLRASMASERKLRETRFCQAAPIATNLILSHVGAHVLGQPKSF